MCVLNPEASVSLDNIKIRTKPNLALLHVSAIVLAPFSITRKLHVVCVCASVIVALGC